MLVGSIGVVVEIALTVDAAGRLLRTPDFLLAGRVGKGLGERRGGSREGTALFGGEVWSVVEAEVELQAIWVSTVTLLLLLLLRLWLLLVVRHGEGSTAIAGQVSKDVDRGADGVSYFELDAEADQSRSAQQMCGRAVGSRSRFWQSRLKGSMVEAVEAFQ